MKKVSILSFVEAISTWPAVFIAFFVLAGFTLYIFRKSISQLIDRIRRIKTNGSGIEISPSPQKKENISAAEKIEQGFGSIVLSFREKAIKEDLQSFNDDKEEREKFLIRALAEFTIALEFEQAYWRIWGSQLLALRFLNSHNRVTVENLRFFYSEKQDELKDITFEEWWNFLDVSNFANIRDDIAHITPAGREFLVYIMKMGYSLHKEF